MLSHWVYAALRFKSRVLWYKYSTGWDTFSVPGIYFLVTHSFLLSYPKVSQSRSFFPLLSATTPGDIPSQHCSSSLSVTCSSSVIDQILYVTEWDEKAEEGIPFPHLDVTSGENQIWYGSVMLLWQRLLGCPLWPVLTQHTFYFFFFLLSLNGLNQNCGSQALLQLGFWKMWDSYRYTQLLFRLGVSVLLTTFLGFQGRR